MTKALTAALIAALSFSAYAADTKKSEGQTTLKAEDLKEKNKVSGADIDEEITNAKMRADSGSKSKWSISAALNYTGGSLTNAFGSERPNIKGTPSVQVNSSMGVQPSVRYRWTPKDSITVGTQLAVMTPLQGSVAKADGTRVKQVNVFDPSISYNRAGKMGELQTITSVSTSVGTSNESREVDNSMSFGASYTALKSWKNGVTFGVSTAIDYNLYTSKPGGNAATASKKLAGYGGDGRVQSDLGIFPFAEYSLNDKYSLRTVFGYFNWKHLYGDKNNWRLLQTYVYQSVGLSISLSRDIYIYPNVQFLPGDLRADYTNVAVSANMNVF